MADRSDRSNADIVSRMREVAARLAGLYPGESARRQPVHTVYGGAHLFRASTARRLGEMALASLDAFAPDAASFCRALSLDAPEPLAVRLYERVREKLAREPVEDFRLDFEDGYGHRPDDEEDDCATRAADEVARGLDERSLPPFIGIRIKPFSGELAARAARTAGLFLARLVERTGGRLPEPFLLTLPKVMDPAQVEAACDLLDELESRLGLNHGAVELELMIETTQSIIAPDGGSALPSLVEAARGRCTGAHFGVYDYTAGCSITARHQAMHHPACAFARHHMQVALGGRGIMLSDGATNVMPIAPHRVAEGGPPLTAAQDAENRRVVHGAWRRHFDDVSVSLQRAFYQGWDLHPAQLPTRYAAVFWFFLESLDAARERLAAFVAGAARAILVGDVFDDAATGQALLNFFLRGLNCGAITEAEATATGLTLEELRSRSFPAILAGRAESARA